MGFWLGVYRRLISVQIRSQPQYRWSFIMDALATALTTALGFLTLALVFQRFDNIAGWSLWEVAFLFGLIEFSFGLMDMIFSGFDPQKFGVQVRLGRFDQILLRPVGITLQVLGSDFVLRRVGRIAQGAVVLGLALANLEIDWTLAKTLYFPVVIASTTAFFGGLFVIGAAITFWTVESIEVMNIFTYGGSEMMSYPMEIYPDWMRRLFTYFLPGIFVVYTPALYFLGKPNPLGMPGFTAFLSPLAGLAVLLIGFWFWKFGIKHYQGTGT